MTTENLSQVKFAEKVVVCLTRSPLYDASTVNLDNELKRFFNNSKQFKLN